MPILEGRVGALIESMQELIQGNASADAVNFSRPRVFAHVVVAHAAFAAPIWNQLTGVLPFRSVWTLTPGNSAAFPIFTRGMSTAVTLIFRQGVANLSPLRLASRLEYKVSRRGRGDEKASGDRVFYHFVDGRGVLRRRLAGDGTATLPFGPSHGRRLDGHQFWSQCRLRLGTGLIKYPFYRWIDKYHGVTNWAWTWG